MVNYRGRPKRYDTEKSRTTPSFTILPDFEVIWTQFNEMAMKDNDEDFIEYCMAIEHTNIATRPEGRRSAYIRWVLSKHVDEHYSEIIGEKEESHD